MGPGEASTKTKEEEALMSRSKKPPLSPEELKERHEYRKRLREAYRDWEKELTEEQLEELGGFGLRDFDCR
jgi:hypothetical protein